MCTVSERRVNSAREEQRRKDTISLCLLCLLLGINYEQNNEESKALLEEEQPTGQGLLSLQ